MHRLYLTFGTNWGRRIFVVGQNVLNYQNWPKRNDWIIVSLSFSSWENIPATIMLCLSFATKRIFFCLYICHRKHKRIFHIVCGIYLLRLSHKLYFAHWTQYRQKIIVYWVRTFMSMTNFSVLSVVLFTMFGHLSLLKNGKKSFWIFCLRFEYLHKSLMNFQCIHLAQNFDWHANF